MTHKNSFFSFFFSKKANAGERWIVGFLIILLAIAFSAVFFGDAFLGNDELMSGFPIWFVPFIIVVLGVGVVYLIRR